MSEKFVNYLKRKGLGPRTIKEYARYYDILEADEGINQEIVNEFLDLHNNGVCRAFLTNLIEFLKKKDIDIPKRTGRKSVKIPKYLTKEEIEVLVTNIDNKRSRIMINLSFQGGLRPSELLNIKPFDFDWNNWKANPEKIGNLKIKGKGNKERMVFISPELMKNIYYYVKSINKTIEKTDPIFRIGIRRWQTILNKLSERILEKKLNPHALRASCATYLHNNGWDILDIKEYLGHANIATTQIYTHINKEDLKNKFDKVF